VVGRTKGQSDRDRHGRTHDNSPAGLRVTHHALGRPMSYTLSARFDSGNEQGPGQSDRGRTHDGSPRGHVRPVVH
jgi:hypothetical protein